MFTVANSGNPFMTPRGVKLLSYLLDGPDEDEPFEDTSQDGTPKLNRAEPVFKGLAPREVQVCVKKVLEAVNVEQFMVSNPFAAKDVRRRGGGELHSGGCQRWNVYGRDPRAGSSRRRKGDKGPGEGEGGRASVETGRESVAREAVHDERRTGLAVRAGARPMLFHVRASCEATEGEEGFK